MNEADMHGTLEAAKKEGLEEGLVEGEKKTKIEIAKKMLSRGRPLEEIIEDTGLTAKEIQSLK